MEILDGMVDAPEEGLDDDCLDDLCLDDLSLDDDAVVSSSSLRLMSRMFFTALWKNRRKRFGLMQCS